MINAHSQKHHEFIDAGLWFGESKLFDLLILHNERGIFIQKRLDLPSGPQWYPVCRYCGKLIPKEQPYSCAPCSMAYLKEALTKMENEYRARIYRLANRIPEGRVMTYGQIAELLDSDTQKYTAQTVGWAMHALGDTGPWARVINAQGACSTGKVMLPGNKQQTILEREGVVFKDGKCDLEKFLWIPDDQIVKECM